MSRIKPIDRAETNEKTQGMLNAVEKKVGMVPNLYATMANSPAVLDAFLSFSKAMSGTSISAPLREQIALVVAGANGCDYCASAHTAVGKKLGVESTELTANLAGNSADRKTQAALDFSKAIVESEGWVSDDEIKSVRDAGYSEGEVTEIVAAVSLNIFTNYFNHVAGTDIDFPLVTTDNTQHAAA